MPAQIKFEPENVVMRGAGASEDFTVDTVLVDASTPDMVVNNVVDKDCVFKRTYSARTAMDVQVTPSGIGPFTIESAAPDACFVRAGRIVCKDKAKQCQFTVKGRAGKRIYKASPTHDIQENTYTDEFLSYLPGTLGEHLRVNVQAFYEGKTPGASSQDMYSSVTYSTDAALCAATVNPNFGQNSASKFACVSFLASTDGSAPWKLPVVLISPRHVVFAHHISPAGPVVFRKADGAFVRTNITARSGVLTGTMDLEVGYIDPPINDITPARVMPSDFFNYMPSAIQDLRGPLADSTLSQDAWPLFDAILFHGNPGVQNSIETGCLHARPVGAVRTPYFDVGFSDSALFPDLRWWKSQTPGLSAYTDVVYGGDSGGPAFALMGTWPVIEPVLLSVTFTGADDPVARPKAAGADLIGNQAIAVNEAMASLSASKLDPNVYTIGVFSLAAYTRFTI